MKNLVRIRAPISGSQTSEAQEGELDQAPRSAQVASPSPNIPHHVIAGIGVAFMWSSWTRVDRLARLSSANAYMTGVRCESEVTSLPSRMPFNGTHCLDDLIHAEVASILRYIRGRELPNSTDLGIPKGIVS